MLKIVREQNLRTEDSKKFFPFTFEVPEGIRETQIRFTYCPKILRDRLKNYYLIKRALEEYRENYETTKADVSSIFRETYPLKNLLTLVVYNAKGIFVGAAHRYCGNSNESIRISSTYSSPGFTPCKITSGSWMVEIEAHAIVTEECRYRLEISLIQKTDE